MSLANGNPVFETVGGDASEATATYTPTGATATQTDNLATVALNANTAAATATTANDTANAAKAAVSGFNTQLTTALSNTVQTSQIGQANGVVGIDSGNGVTVTPKGGAAYLTFSKLGSGGAGTLQFYCDQNASATGPDCVLQANWGSGKGDGIFYVTAAQFQPNKTNVTALGTANNAWSGIVSQNAVQVISDINDKNVVGRLGDENYTGQTTKLRAAWAAISGVIYTLKASTNVNPRNHIGVIAQTVQAAFTAQGLDPSDWGLWCSTPKTKVVETITTDPATGKSVVTETIQPIYEADGKTQATQQTVRYEELLSLGVFCERLERADLAARVTALEAKSATSTTPSA